jgi:hypothetical protein
MGIRDTLFTLMTLVIMVYNSVVIVTGFSATGSDGVYGTAWQVRGGRVFEN